MIACSESSKIAPLIACAGWNSVKRKNGSPPGIAARTFPSCGSPNLGDGKRRLRQPPLPPSKVSGDRSWRWWATNRALNKLRPRSDVDPAIFETLKGFPQNYAPESNMPTLLPIAWLHRKHLG